MDAFHKTFRQWFVERVKSGKPLTRTDLDDVPIMTFEEEPASSLFLRVGLCLLLLLLGAGLLIGLSWPGLATVGRLTR